MVAGYIVIVYICIIIVHVYLIKVTTVFIYRIIYKRRRLLSLAGGTLGRNVSVGISSRRVWNCSLFCCILIFCYNRNRLRRQRLFEVVLMLKDLRNENFVGWIVGDEKGDCVNLGVVVTDKRLGNV